MNKDSALRQMLVQLEEPWWTPLPPNEYVILGSEGRPAGVGLIVEWNYDAWNLAIALAGSMTPPADIDGHRHLVCTFILAKTQIAPIDVLGYSLGSYAMLMRPNAFEKWLRNLPRRALDIQVRRKLINGLVALQASETLPFARS